MVDCGVAAMMGGHDGPAVIELAGSSQDECVLDILPRLEAAARELGIPWPSDSSVWVAAVADAMDPLVGDEVPVRSESERFEAHLLVLFDNLQRAAPRSPAATRFLSLVEKHVTRRVGEFEPWVQAVESAASELCPGAFGEVARAAASLIQAVAYAAVESTDVAACRSLRERSEALPLPVTD